MAVPDENEAHLIDVAHDLPCLRTVEACAQRCAQFNLLRTNIKRTPYRCLLRLHTRQNTNAIQQTQDTRRNVDFWQE
jgi:hypothetical protein